MDVSYFTIDELTEIKNSVTRQDFLDVLNYYGIPMKKDSILCPFHSDRHYGSAMISPGWNSAFCFVCQRSIDVFDLIMEQEGVDFTEAVKVFWCDIMGNPVPEQKEAKDWRPGRKDLEFIGLGVRTRGTQVAYLNMVPRTERNQLPTGWMYKRDQYDEELDMFACGEMVRISNIRALDDEDFWPVVIGKAKENLEYRQERLQETENPLTLAGHECCLDKEFGQKMRASLQEDIRRVKSLISRMERAYAHAQVKKVASEKEKAS